MTTVPLEVSVSDVMKEVANCTAYTGAKMGEGASYDRISTVDEDRAQLDKFFGECRSDLCQELIGMIKSEGIFMSDPDTYALTLIVSSAFDQSLMASMVISLRSFFIFGIAAKWFIYTNKGEAGEYADKAAAMLDDIHRKALYKRKPTRPTYD